MIFLKRLFLVGLLFFELTTEMNSVIHKKNGIFVKKRRLVVNVSNPVVHVQEPEEIIDQQIKEKRPIMTSVLDEEPLKIGYTVKVNNVFVNRILPLKFSKEINVNINNVNLLIKINQFSVRNQKELFKMFY